MGALADFLNRNSILPSGGLPLTHCTAALNIRDIIDKNILHTARCEVFSPDSLTYFFVGRPAYKKSTSGRQAKYWELPACFVFEYEVVGKPKRIFPFDSGALKSGRYPGYISSMDIQEFEVSSVPDAPKKIIGAYFGNTDSYFKGDAKGKVSFEDQFSLGAFDHELRALHTLAMDANSQEMDDRRFSIEVQIDRNLDLSVARPVAVIVPNQYLGEKRFIEHVDKQWGAQPIGYNTHTLSLESYYSQIYDKVEGLYRSMGLI